MIDAKVSKDSDIEFINTISNLEDENKVLKQELLIVESESNKLSDRLYNFTNGIANSTNSIVLLNDVQIDGVLLRLEYTYLSIESCAECENGYEVIQGWNLIKRTITANDYVPIYMYGKQNNLRQVSWEYLSNLDYNPILEIFQDNRWIYLIKESERLGSLEEVLEED